MPGYTRVNLKEVEDSARKFGMPEELEARFAAGDLGVGVSLQRLAPNFRLPFGHRHERQEELYVVLNGSGRIKLDDEIMELRQWDAVRVPPDVARGIESGSEGIEVLAVNAAPPARDTEQLQGWWGD